MTLRFLLVILLGLLAHVDALICDCDFRYCTEKFCETDGLCFVSLMRSEKDGSVMKQTRCIDKAYLLPPERPFVCEYNFKNNHTYVSKCCGHQDLCNANLDLQLATPSVDKEQVDMEEDLIKYQIILAAVIPLFALLLFLPILYFYQRKRHSSPENYPCFPCCDLEMCCRSGFYHEVESLETQSTYPVFSIQECLSGTSGSGSGFPLLVQRSVARQINLVEIIGKGRFGEVWRGCWRGEDVAVKIFMTVDEKSWFREVEIYQTVMLRHPNILGFIAADNKDIGTWTQLWLVMEYMENGSLFGYLKMKTLTLQELIEMCRCVVTGLAHLHMEIVGTHGKPAIAHRDLKSKNILVRGDGTCAIGDLGLSVRYSQSTNTIDLPQNSKVGTKRYLAPELLNESLNPQDFEAFKRADIYSLGLVFWEMAMRCKLPGQATSVPDHSLPYYEIVGPDPSIEEMKKVVCVDAARPVTPNFWTGHPLMSKVTKLLNECWYETANSRLTALRVKKTINEMSTVIISSKENIA